MRKRLCELVELIENNKDCAVFTVKQETSPLDLVKLGGFEGHECMFRMSKDPRTTCITVFRDGDEPYHMSYGSSTTLVTEDRRKVRDLITECVNLDFGIFTRGEWHKGYTFEQLVATTLGERDVHSPKQYELQRGSGYCSLFVNGQHISNISNGQLDEWLSDRGVKLCPDGIRGSIEVGHIVRADAPQQDMEPSLDDALGKAKEKAAERNAARPDGAKGDKPRNIER